MLGQQMVNKLLSKNLKIWGHNFSPPWFLGSIPLGQPPVAFPEHRINFLRPQLLISSAIFLKLTDLLYLEK